MGRFSALTLSASIGLAGCGTPLLPQKIIPIDEVIVAHKRALSDAQSKTLFEEFVGYRELGSTFNLSAITNTSIEVSTTVTDQATEVASAKFVLPKGGEFGNQLTIGVTNTQNGKTNITLVPIANSPQAYRAIKAAFDGVGGRGKIYELLFYDSNGNAFDDFGKPLPLDVKRRCAEENYCFHVLHLFNANQQAGFAYLKDVREFRKLFDTISLIAPPPEPPKAPPK